MTATVKRGAFKRTCRRCSWTGTYDTAGKADYAKRKHSCEKWQAAAASAERGRARAEAVDRTPKPCLHKVAQHEHGTYACYTLDACRCDPCAAAVRDYETNRVRQQAYGRWNGLVDAEPSRRHVRQLMDQGMGLKRIVAVSGVPSGQLWKLLYGRPKADGTRVPSKRVRPSTEQRLLAVRLDLADGAVVDNTGTTRRLQALVALGWSQSKLGVCLGIELGNMGALVHGRRNVTWATAKAVRALYEDLSMQLPPAGEWRDKIAASRSRSYAQKRGWLPPLAWDDELLDDPSHQPTIERDRALAHVDEVDEAAIYRRMHGDKTVRLSKADAAELVRRWAATDRPLNECERITGIKPDRYLRLKDQPNTTSQEIAS